jgi:hypothetical protein
MSAVLMYLDCGCAIMKDGTRAVCPTCATLGTVAVTESNWSMPKPVCIPCKREMQVSKIGAVVQFNALAKNGAYEQWRADLVKCPGCGAEVAARYGQQPTWTTYGNAANELERALVIVQERPWGTGE